MKALIIDDHGLFREGIQLVLKRLDPNIIVHTAESYEDSLPFFEANTDLDLILMDLGLPGLSGKDAVISIRKKSPTIPLIIISANSCSVMVKELLQLGVQGYITKSSTSVILINAIQLVLSGGIYIPSEILQCPTSTEHTATSSEAPTLSKPNLTHRQHEVLELLTDGYSNKEIGSKLSMAEATVRIHVAAILKQLKVNNRTRAANLAIKNNWIGLED